MYANIRPSLVLGLSIFATIGAIKAQEPNSSLDGRITPEELGLPKNSTRTSEPFVTRIYKTDDAEQILKKQPDGYPFTIKDDYSLKENETARVHQGVDFSSHPVGLDAAKPLDFKAGVYGMVVRAGGGDWGTIGVQLRDGSVLQYLHTTASHVKVGDIVAPDTVLGVTGRRGTSAIHLHIQAKDKNGNAISPDLAFRIGQKKLSANAKPEDGAGADFNPDLYSGVKPTVKGGKVRSKVEPKSKWVVEVIGGGGKVHQTLGEFYSYNDAFHCSIRWSQDHPDDLRLTREREVILPTAEK
jgi:murein DD-endopeptidase MepM/ murein hydrolase activator NlpD